MVNSQQVLEYLDARRHAFSSPEVFRTARKALLACDKAEVLAHFEARTRLPDEEERAQAMEGFALLYRQDATDALIRWLKDPSSIVRWVICGCLNDYGDERATAALLDRMKHDTDCQVRGVAAYALGSIGAVEALPDLHRTYQTDLEVDQLGYTPSCQAQDAMTSVLRCWVSRQLQGTPPKTFGESTPSGQLSGTVTAEAIPFDAEGRITCTSRYAHLPISAFGNGWMARLDLHTSLIAPFEIMVEYVDPICVIRRIFVYQRLDGEDVNWAVNTILDPTAMQSPPSG